MQTLKRVGSSLKVVRHLRKSPPTRRSSRRYIQSINRPLVIAETIVPIPHGLDISTSKRIQADDLQVA